MTLVLFLVQALIFMGRACAVPAPENPHMVQHSTPSSAEFSSRASTCNDISNCRTLSHIIYSCLATIFACTWVSYHPDVPNRTHTLWRIRVTRLFSVTLSFLMPELTVAKAASQFWQVQTYEPPPYQGWTRIHTYFTIMGGFFDSWKPILEYVNMRDLTTDSHPEMIKLPPSEDPRKDHEAAPESATPPTSQHPPPQPWISVTESEIVDKSKGDVFGKLVAVLQTTWFIVEYVGRWSSRQPRTQLEVITLAYAAMNCIIYILWWEKPLNIREQIDIRGRMIPPTARQKSLHGAWISVMGGAMDSMFGPDPWPTLFVFPVIGMLFGGIHCFAWQFPFPTRHEMVLWRVGAVFCTVCPIITPLIIFLAFVVSLPAAFGGADSALGYPAVFFSALLVVCYISCRIILLVMTVTCLRSPLPGIYEATNWTFYFPHFG